MPGRGGVRMLVDAASTDDLDTLADLDLALTWLAVLVALTAVSFHRFTAPKRI